MNKRIFKFIVLAASVFLISCGGSNNKEDKKSNEIMETSSLPGIYPIVEDEITLKVFVPADPFINDLSTNELTKEYEEKTNVKIEWEEVPNISIQEKINLMFSANGDMPDILLKTQLSNPQITNYGSNLGLLRDLTPYIEKYGPNIQKLLDYDPEIRKAVTALDGKIYTIPALEEAYHVRAPQKLWVDKKMLADAGVDIPQTTEEFYELLKIMKNDLGIATPLTGAITGWSTNVIDFFMCSFIYSDQDKRWIVEGGEVSVPFDKSEWREGLKYLNKLYSEGLLDEGAFIQDQAQLRQLAMSGRVGAVTAGSTGAFAPLDRRTDYTTIPPLEGPEGVRLTAHWPRDLVTGVFSVPTASRYPDVAVRWIDYFLSEEGSLRSRHGLEGRDWRRGEPGEVAITGGEGRYTSLMELNKNQNVHWWKSVPQFFHSELRNSRIDQSAGTGKMDIEKMLYEETKKYDKYLKEEVIKDVYMDLDAAGEFTELDYLIPNYVDEMAAKFILGHIDVYSDSEWKGYINNLKRMGIDKYVGLMDEAYKNQYVN